MFRASRFYNSLPLAASLFGLMAAVVPSGCTADKPVTQNGSKPKPKATRIAQTPRETGNTAAASTEGNLLLGNPLTGGPKIDSFILSRPQFALSYNKSKGESNWVAWHTDESNFGDTKRGKFRPDPDLPEAWQITPSDYTNSGYDRGHLCPSADRNDSRKNNDATFYMSNMVPQAKALNQKVWADLENDLRGMVRDGDEIYQISGGRGEVGRIGDGKVVVPEYCWKIAVILPVGTNDLQRIPKEAQILAVEMKNEENPAYNKADWRTYLTTVDALEKSTGFNFLNALSETDQVKLESAKYAG